MLRRAVQDRACSITLTGLILFGMAGGAQAAPLLYIFEYDPFEGYAAASITFSSPDFADSNGDTLTYVSGQINGCAPASLTLVANAFATPIADPTHCGDATGPNVDGLFFQPDIMPPLTAGVFPSTQTAGRQFDINSESSYRYGSGSLTIQQVPEPATVGLFGVGLAALSGIRRRTSRRH